MAWSDCFWKQVWHLLFLPSEVGQSHPAVAACCVFSESPIHSHWIIIVLPQVQLCHALIIAHTIFRVTVASVWGNSDFKLYLSPLRLLFYHLVFLQSNNFIAPFLSSLFHLSLPSHSPTWSICWWLSHFLAWCFLIIFNSYAPHTLGAPRIDLSCDIFDSALGHDSPRCLQLGGNTRGDSVEREYSSPVRCKEENSR